MLAPAPIRKLSGRPIVGNLLEMRRDRLALLGRLVAECGDVGWFRVGPAPVLALASPEIIRQLLVDRADAFVKGPGLRRYGRPIFGDGLLTSEGELHRRRRKLLAPAFAPKRMAGYGPTMVRWAERTVSSWRDGATIDVAEEMMNLTLAIVGSTLFDVDVTGDARVVGEALTVVMRYMVESVSRLPAPYWWPLPRNLRARRAVAQLDEVIHRIITERRATGTRDHGDVLSMLLLAHDEDHGGMDDQQVRDEAMTLMSAGHETTANALAWALHLLERHPEARKRLESEVDRVLGGRTVRAEDLPALPWSLAVLKEAMRLYPPAYMLARRAEHPVELAGIPVRKGGLVIVNIYGMHRRASYFEEPELFRPERFEPERERALVRGAYLPFGGGERVCIGAQFALLEAQLILVTIAQRVRLERVREGAVDGEPLVTLRPRGGLPMRVVQRAANR